MMTFNYIRKGNWLFPVKPPKQKGYHFLLLVSFLLFSFTTWSQVGPGGETTNLKLWFKADSGVTETSGTLSAWAEASNNTSVTETVNGDPQFTSIGINFNPYISFDGTGDQVLTGSHLDLSGQNAGSIFMVYATETVSRDVIFGVTNTGELDMELQILGDSKIGLNDGGVENFVSSSNAINDGAFRIASALRNDVNWSLFSNADGGSTNTSGPTSNFGTGTYGISPTSAFMYTGKIAEVIVFNADVTSARPKIESYLAIKYGLTMDQTTATDYVSSAWDGTSETVNVIWDASANSGYTNDITIIGQDDNSGLDQRISKNSRPGTGSDIPWVTLATTNNFVAANSDSNRTPLGNGNFMAISSDTGTTEFETTFDAVADARMNKVWKVSETGTVGNIFIAIPKTGPTKYFGANGVNAIVVSADLNFNTLDTVVILQDNNNMYFAEINPANGNFFTFANVPLSISGISSATVSENAAYTSSTPSISPSVTVTYSLSGADASKFTVNSSTGVVQMTAKNFEAPEDADSNNVYELTLIATDDGGNTAELAYNVTVTDVDEVVDLTLSGISNTTINENTAYNSTAYNLSGSPFGTATFSLVGADKNLFTLDTNTNIVSMVAKDFEAPSDSNGDNVYEVGVFVVDTAGNSDTLTWTVTVTNVNETANFSIQTIADVSIMENTVYQSVTPTITGTPLGTVTFSMQGSDSDDFNINSSTGVLTLSNPDFENPTDTDNNNIYEIGVVATDADGNTANTSWQVTVTNVSETATLIITEIEDTTVDENQTYSSGVPAYTGVPVGAPIFSISGADASKFSVNETTGVVSMTAQNFESPTDANTDNGYEVTLIMKDADNNTDTESWKVVVRNVEEVSILNLGQMDNAYIPENTTYTSEAPVLTGTPIGDITYTIEGDDASQFMINALTGVVSMQSKDFENPTDANIDNVYEIIIRIRDGDSNTATTSLKVEVSNVKNEGGTVNGLVELQELIDKGEDIKISHLKNIIGILRLALENEKGYSIAIHQNKSKLSNPPTLEEIQTLVDRVNAEQANPKVSVVSFIGPGMEGERNAWVIPDLYKFPNNTVFVYNRWGKKIFEQKGYQNDWRGIYEGNNKPLPSGSYYYQIDLNNNGVIDQDGWIYISN